MQLRLGNEGALKEDPKLHNDIGTEDEEENEVSEQEEPVHEEELLDDGKEQQDDKPTRSVASLLSRFQYKSALDVGDDSDTSDFETDNAKNTSV